MFDFAKGVFAIRTCTLALRLSSDMIGSHESVSSCRQLDVRKLTKLQSQQVALESFTWYPGRQQWRGSVATADEQFIASLTTLTYLELTETPTWSNFEALHNLQQLRTLVLVHCYGLRTKLFVPGAFTSLISLHIKGTCVWGIPAQAARGLHLHNSETEDKGQDLSKIGADILALPSLKELSGCCDIFDVLMLNGMLEGWHCVEYGFFGTRTLRRWTKAL